MAFYAIKFSACKALWLSDNGLFYLSWLYIRRMCEEVNTPVSSIWDTGSTLRDNARGFPVLFHTVSNISMCRNSLAKHYAPLIISDCY